MQIQQEEEFVLKAGINIRDTVIHHVHPDDGDKGHIQNDGASVHSDTTDGPRAFQHDTVL
jgi:hypothetical protein